MSAENLRKQIEEALDERNAQRNAQQIYSIHYAEEASDD